MLEMTSFATAGVLVIALIIAATMFSMLMEAITKIRIAKHETSARWAEVEIEQAKATQARSAEAVEQARRERGER
jgi:hypothetical protein